MIEVWNEYNHNFPIVVSIPHSGTFIPDRMKEKLCENVLLPNMDWYLEKLYSFLKDLGITTIINNTSRYVIDVNRKIEEKKTDSYSENYVYLKTTFNDNMYKSLPTETEIQDRIKLYYNPYHQKLNDLIKEKEKQFKKFFLIDLHSFGRDLKVDIVLGNKTGESSSNSFFLNIQRMLESIGFQIALNTPYSGGYIIKEYSSNTVETVQIELNYQKYIDQKNFGKEELPNINEPLFLETQGMLKIFFIQLINIYKKDA